MKNYRKTITTLLMAAALLTAVFMTGCSQRTETADTPAGSGDAVAAETASDTGNAASDAAAAQTDGSEALTLPILDEIDATVTVGISGSSLSAVQAAAKLLDWGANTGLDTEEIGKAASEWLAARNDDQSECLQKLEMVDGACKKLLTDEARELLDVAGCADTEITWGSQMPEPVEAIMQAAGLR